MSTIGECCICMLTFDPSIFPAFVSVWSCAMHVYRGLQSRPTRQHLATCIDAKPRQYKAGKVGLAVAKSRYPSPKLVRVQSPAAQLCRKSPFGP